MFRLFKKKSAEEPIPTVSIHELVGGVSPTFAAYRIDNGYLVRFGPNSTNLASSVVYCANEQAIAEALVAERAKAAMGLTVDKAARYGVNPLYTDTTSSASSPTVRLSKNFSAT